MRKEYESPVIEVVEFTTATAIMSGGDCTMGFDCPDNTCVTDSGSGDCSYDLGCIGDTDGDGVVDTCIVDGICLTDSVCITDGCDPDLSV